MLIFTNTELVSVPFPPFSQAKSQNNKFLSIYLILSDQICHNGSCYHLGGFLDVSFNTTSQLKVEAEEDML